MPYSLLWLTLPTPFPVGWWILTCLKFSINSGNPYICWWSQSHWFHPQGHGWMSFRAPSYIPTPSPLHHGRLLLFREKTKEKMWIPQWNTGCPISPWPNLKHPLGFSSDIITAEKLSDPEQTAFTLPSWDLHKLFLLIYKSSYTLLISEAAYPSMSCSLR